MSHAVRARVSVHDDGRSVRVRVPMRLKRRSGRKLIIIPEGMGTTEKDLCTASRSLAMTIARAFHWEELLASGRYSSVSDLAAALELNRSFVARMLRLTLLAPDIIETILRGDEPSGLTYGRLRTGSVPDQWVEQRERWGF